MGLAEVVIPASFWTRLKAEGLVSVGPPVTLRHAVLFRLTEAATPEETEAMAVALRALPKQVPQIAALSCGADAGLSGGNFDFSLTVDFADAAGYEAYAKHPAHQEVIARYIKPILQPGTRTAVQFSL